MQITPFCHRAFMAADYKEATGFGEFVKPSKGRAEA
jgi:hypothetical protein